MNSDTGLLLKQARENLGLDPITIEKELKIRSRIITALEAGAFDQLPDPVTAAGMVKNYARRLGLDPEQTVISFKEEMRLRGVKKREIDFPEITLPGTFKPLRLAAPIALALILIGGYFGLFSEKPKHTEHTISRNAAAIIYEKTGRDVTPGGVFDKVNIAEQTDQKAKNSLVAAEPKPETPAPQTVVSQENSTITAQPAPSENLTGATAETSNTEPAPVSTETATPAQNLNALVRENAVDPTVSGQGVILTAPRGDSWIEIKEEGGKTIYSGLLAKDGSYAVPPSDKPLLLKVGAGYALDVTIDGETVSEPFGKDASVLRNIPLTRESLKNFQP